jgi:hypothetical protein
MVARDGTNAVCARVSVGGVYCGEPGYRHVLKGQPVARTTSKLRERVPLDASSHAQRFERAITTDQIAAVSTELGVSVESLRRLRIGWCQEHDAPAFPMWQRGTICGIRIWKHGAKFCLLDSQNGFFIPRGFSSDLDVVYIVEGPTDTAALLDMGLDAIGKPNVNACTNELISWLLEHRPGLAVFVGENDNPDARGVVAGIDKTKEQCSRATAAGLSTAFVLPPRGKDVREWKTRYGGTRDMLELLVRNAT